LAFSFLENYIGKFPHQRHLARTIANKFRTEVGLSTVYQELMKIFADTTELLANIGRSTYNLPPIFENRYSLERIGEMVEQTAVARNAQKLGILDIKPILILPDINYLVNKAFLPYLADTFEIVSNDHEVAFFNQMMQAIPYFGQHMKLTNEIHGQGNEILPHMYRFLIKMGKRPFAFEILEETRDKAVKFLSSYDIDLNQPFVTLHLREKGYVDGSQHEWRNINVLDYVPAIKWLLKQGIQILRIGHPKMSSIGKMTGLTDLTSVDRPGEVDIYSCAKNLFFYGTASGPSQITYQFGAPTLYTYVECYWVTHHNGLTQFLPMKRIKDNTLVKLAELTTSELRLIHHPSALIRNGLEPVPISVDEHLNSAKEMLEFLAGGNIVKKNRDHNNKKLQSNIPEDIYLTSSSLNML